MTEVVLLVGTRKGAFLFHGDPERTSWRIDGPHFLGSIVHHLVLDPRDGVTLLMAARTGHFGRTVFRSVDFGRTWAESRRPPAFRKLPEGGAGRTVEHVFWLTPGHSREPGVWYAGTSPQGLFRSDDGGVTWLPGARQEAGGDCRRLAAGPWSDAVAPRASRGVRPGGGCS